MRVRPRRAPSKSKVPEGPSKSEAPDGPSKSKVPEGRATVRVETNYLPFGLGQGNCFSSRETLFPRVAGLDSDSEASILTPENP